MRRETRMPFGASAVSSVAFMVWTTAATSFHFSRQLIRRIGIPRYVSGSAGGIRVADFAVACQVSSADAKGMSAFCGRFRSSSPPALSCRSIMDASQLALANRGEKRERRSLSAVHNRRKLSGPDRHRPGRDSLTLMSALGGKRTLATGGAPSRRSARSLCD
jgi:hypothetical protein